MRELERKATKERKDKRARDSKKRQKKQGTTTRRQRQLKTEKRGSHGWSECVKKREKEGEREYAVFCHRQGVACDKSPS